MVPSHPTEAGMQNRLRQNKLIVYKLKNAYGQKGYLYQPASAVANIETGKVETSYTITRIRKAVLLPSELARKYVFDLGYMAAAKNFTYGGLFDRELRLVLISAAELKGAEPTLNDYFVLGSKMYKIEKAYMGEEDSSWLLRLTHIDATDDVIVPEFVVSGTDEDIDGDYNQNGEYNSKKAYQKTTEDYWLWYHTDSKWYISATKGDLLSDYWGPNTEIQGSYVENPTPTTTAEVTLVR